MARAAAQTSMTAQNAVAAGEPGRTRRLPRSRPLPAAETPHGVPPSMRTGAAAVFRPALHTADGIPVQPPAPAWSPGDRRPHPRGPTRPRPEPARRRPRGLPAGEATSTAVPGDTSLAAFRPALVIRCTAAVDRQRSACAVPARADVVSDKISAQLRFRECLPDLAPRTAPATAMQSSTGSPTPTPWSTRHSKHWAGHLAGRHRILARSLADRGHTLADFPPAWARRSEIRRPPALPGVAARGPPPMLLWNCGAPATPSPVCQNRARIPPT